MGGTWFSLRPYMDRALKVIETRAEVAKPKPLESSPMPANLYSFAMGESEEWARQNTIKVMREMYEECGDWTAVYNTMLLREVREEKGLVS